MRRILLTLSVCTFPLSAWAQQAPSVDEMAEAIGTVFARMGCSLDVSDGEEAELAFATLIGEEIGEPVEQVMSQDDGGLYDVVGDALGSLTESGALVFDEEMATLTMTDCTPVE
ncbi:MAG: hypothetical protein HLUCCA08_04070 [Rhodobacteraceae bacterium HLUCCA08]|nr:MAG: hypothetical protein HLUCCA08_04070 [Rhodobacteraceae bacterium HLUCCA08]